MLEERRFVTCQDGHIARSDVIQRFQLHFRGGTRTSTDPPLDHKKLALPAKKETLSTLASSCFLCGSSDACTIESTFLKMPELLIIQCPFRVCLNHLTWEDFAYRVSLEEEIILRPGDKERYVLVGATLVTGQSFKNSLGHVVAAVRTSSGNIAIVDDSNHYSVGPRWSTVEGMQIKPDRSDVLLPQMLLYRRKYEPPPAPPSYHRGSLSTDPNIEKVVVAMQLALPHIGMDDLLWEYYLADDNIQNTVDYFLTGRYPKKEITLDQVLPAYLEDVIRAYVRYPQLGVRYIYETIQKDLGNFDYALKQLEDRAGRRINYASYEYVGDAGLEVDLDVVDGEFIDGQAQVVNKKTKHRMTARLFGVLVDPDRHHPRTPDSSPRQSASQSPVSPTPRSPRGQPAP